MTVPIKYDADRARAEAILVATAQKHTSQFMKMGEVEAQELQRRYLLRTPDFEPRVYLRITDNWLELSLRFVARDHGVRELKDAMTREILAAFGDAGIVIASSTVELVGAPPLKLLSDDDR